MQIRRKSRYNASLLANGLKDDKRELAEKKYIEMLESVFGSASQVCGAYCEYVAVRSLRAESPFDTITPEEHKVLKRWEEVESSASRAVLSELQIADNDAVFELRVWNSRTG